MNEIAGVEDIPDEIADSEALNRRIHSTFAKPDGSVSSQAFTDEELSVDRALYREVSETLRGYAGYGVASITASVALELEQVVIAKKELLNPAHALVIGKKTKSIARSLARSAAWVVSFGNAPLTPHL